MDVTDRVAVVTGGGRGIGRGICLALARYGADVVVADVNLEDAEAVRDEAAAMGRRTSAQYLDVTDQGSVDSMVADALSRYGRIDILVNNAGIIGAPGWQDRVETTEEDWDLLYAVNVKGMAAVTDAVSPHMKERRYGKVVNIASVAGRQGNYDNPPYGISKAGVISFTQAYAMLAGAFQRQRQRHLPRPALDPHVGEDIPSPQLPAPEHGGAVAQGAVRPDGGGAHTPGA